MFEFLPAEVSPYTKLEMVRIAEEAERTRSDDDWMDPPVTEIPAPAVMRPEALRVTVLVVVVAVTVGDVRVLPEAMVTSPAIVEVPVPDTTRTPPAVMPVVVVRLPVIFTGELISSVVAEPTAVDVVTVTALDPEVLITKPVLSVLIDPEDPALRDVR